MMQKTGYILLCFSLVSGLWTAQASLHDGETVTDSIAPVRIEQVFYDADSVPLGTYYYTNTALDSTVYFRPNGRRMAVRFEMPEYEGGYDSLRVFFDEKFSQIEGKAENMNALALVYILLENGKVTRVHIGDRIAYNNRGLNYDREIKKILFQTKDKWIVPEEDKSEPRLFVYLFTLN